MPWIAPGTSGQALAIGVAWLVLMLAFEIGFGRLYLGVPWPRIVADFDLRKGGFLAFGMLVLLGAPLLIARLHGLF